MCGSDFHAFAGRHPAYIYPRVLGHELSGIVLDAPENDFGIEAGDRSPLIPTLIAKSAVHAARGEATAVSACRCSAYIETAECRTWSEYRLGCCIDRTR